VLHVPRNNFEHQVNFAGHRKDADDTLDFRKVLINLKKDK